jgi:hypothetical protein
MPKRLVSAGGLGASVQDGFAFRPSDAQVMGMRRMLQTHLRHSDIATTLGLYTQPINESVLNAQPGGRLPDSTKRGVIRSSRVEKACSGLALGSIGSST